MNHKEVNKNPKPSCLEEMITVFTESQWYKGKLLERKLEEGGYCEGLI